MNLAPLSDWPVEAQAISVLLRDYGRFLALGLTQQDFTKEAHLAVLRAGQALSDSGQAVTHEAITLELQRLRLDGIVDGQKGVLELRRGSPATVLDCERLKKLSALRGLLEALLGAVQLAGAEDLPGAMGRVDEALAFGKGTASVLDLRQLVELALEAGGKDAQERHKTIFPGSDQLERAIGGFRPGGMYVLGALSNVGKSYLAQSWAMAIAHRGVAVGWVSLEDPAVTTGSRALGMLSGIEPRTIELGSAIGKPGAETDLYAGHGRAMSIAGKFLYTDLTGQTELDVCAAMSVMAARGARLVVVDYVGVITSSKDQQDRRNEVRFIAIKLKQHAKRLGIALLLVSQLTMPRDDAGVAKEPSKYSLRESGDLTNAAEAIIVAWRDEESDDSPVNLVVAKSKTGGVGMHWTASRNRYTHIFEDTSDAKVRVKEQKPKPRGGFGT